MYNTDRKSLIKVKTLKNDILRHNEYYDMQNTFDRLYQQSKDGNTFTRLFDLIISNENILLAFRNIKRNKGSKTAGTNGKTIEYWEKQSTENFLKYIKARISNYIPQKIKRVEIPKSNGKMRPLGIPNIEDRLIQQCFKQILEPICEAKFHPHSYGFRPNRSTEHAIAYLMKKINIDKSHFIVDIDIKGFFDNVSHGKLLKQIWAMGIQDKRVISIISKMLKAEIQGIGIPDKGVPQGGIMSPLLANIVLNELDWWISNQWETFETSHEYAQSNNKYRKLRTTRLKEIYIVRYADDFKIVCKKYSHAKRIYQAVQLWLGDRLQLQISEEKSKITDVRKSSSEFLGINIKARKSKKKQYIVTSSLTKKAIESAKDVIKKQITYIEKHPVKNQIYLLNRIIAGLHNYYEIATLVNKDFRMINYSLSKRLKTRLLFLTTKSGSKSKEYLMKYGHYGGKELYVLNSIIYPIYGVKTKAPFLFQQSTSNYTVEGRKKLHDKLGCIDKDILKYLTYHPIASQSVEVNDNRLSLYYAQQGKCRITGQPLDISMEVHHIIPTSLGGSDRYDNLILITYEAHKLIHSVSSNIINFYLSLLKLDIKNLKKMNKYRKKVGNEIIKTA